MKLNPFNAVKARGRMDYKNQRPQCPKDVLTMQDDIPPVQTSPQFAGTVHRTLPSSVA